MTTLSRTLVAAATGLVLLGTAGCFDGGIVGGGGEQEPPKETEAAGLKNFDPCAFPNPDELAEAGVEPSGEPVDNVDFERGCRFTGEKMSLTLFKNQGETVASYEKTGSWDSFEKVKINGRDAANGMGAGVAGQGGCATLVDAGGGVVLAQVTGAMRDSLPDPCAVSQKIATDLEPRMPK